MTSETGKNPAFQAFVEAFQNEKVFGEVLIRRVGSGFVLCHVADAEVPSSKLEEVPVERLRAWAQFDAKGRFRPLKAAPDLKHGWRSEAAAPEALEGALQALYPGALADWHAAQGATPPTTGFRDFVDRQTGMYQAVQAMNDLQAAQAVRACCHASMCLKRRLWTVGEIETDPPHEKSVIPCLEPCAILLEFARAAFRMDQTEKTSFWVGGEELTVLRQAIEAALQHDDPMLRKADFSAPGNPRRLRWLLERLPALPSDTEETVELRFSARERATVTYALEWAQRGKDRSTRSDLLENLLEKMGQKGHIEAEPEEE